MAIRATKFASAVAAGLLAGMPMAIAQPAANATDCLTAPRQDTPQGQHWYYRLEHGTKRHCWYLREAGDNVSRAAPSDDSSSAPSAVAGQTDSSMQSLENAHAELPGPQPPAQNNAGSSPAPAVPPSAPSATPPTNGPFPDPPQAASDAGSSVASRWPAPSAANSSAAPPARAADSADPASRPQAATTPAPAARGSTDQQSATAKPSASDSVSLQMLFMVILGALALAGLTASVVYRFGRARHIRIDAHQRRAAIWEGVEDAPQPPWVEPAPEMAAPRSTTARSAAPTATPQERYHKIEEILAQLVKQAQQSDA